MHVKRLFVRISVLFGLLIVNFSQAQHGQPNWLVGTSLGGVTTGRNDAVGELSKPFQPGDVDTLSVSETCGSDTAYLCCERGIGADGGIRASTRRGVSDPKPCGILGWQKRTR